MNLPSRETQLSVEQQSTAYADAWKRALQWKKVYQGNAAGEHPKRVAAMSLLTPPPPVLAELAENPQRSFEVDVVPIIAQMSAEYASTRNLASHTPQDIQIILYPTARSRKTIREYAI